MYSHKNAGDKELLPGLSESSTNWRKHTEDGRDEDSSTTAEVVVARITDPTTDERTSNIWASIDKPNKQVVCPTIWRSLCISLAYSELDREGQICSIGSSLIPAMVLDANRESPFT